MERAECLLLTVACTRTGLEDGIPSSVQIKEPGSVRRFLPSLLMKLQFSVLLCEVNGIN